MAEMSVIWLSVAAAFYSLGLLHAILTLVRRREHLFRVAMTAFTLGTVFHFVSIVEEGIVNNRCPIANFYETLAMCALLVALVYLGVQLRYHVESLSVFIFPLVFVMSLVATLGNPVSAWSSPIVRTTWLTVHIVLVLLGYAALLFTAVASLLYLFQERELKSKKPNKFYYRLPPLGTLDELVSKFMAIGFVLITLAVIAGATWAFIELKADWIRLRADYSRRDRRRHLGIHRIEGGLDPPAEDCNFVLHLGNLPRHGVPAGHGGVARAQGGDHDVDGGRVFRGDVGRPCAAGKPAAEMKLLITGVSHKTAPVEVRECLAFREETHMGR